MNRERIEEMMAGIAAESNAIEPGTMCDFCSRETTALTAFPCQSFDRRVIVRGTEMIIEGCVCHTPVATMPGDIVAIEHMIGDWAACSECAAAIAAHDKLALAKSAVAAARERHADHVQPALFFLGIHEPFWFHREG